VSRIRFGDDLVWVPNRAWAKAWVDGVKDYWPPIIDDYRDRVQEDYADEFEDDPDAFPFMRPTCQPRSFWMCSVLYHPSM
jgi:hypothetical protein